MSDDLHVKRLFLAASYLFRDEIDIYSVDLDTGALTFMLSILRVRMDSFQILYLLKQKGQTLEKGLLEKAIKENAAASGLLAKILLKIFNRRS